MLGVIFVYGLLFFAIYIAYFSKDQSKNNGTNSGTKSDVYNDYYTQTHRTNRVDNTTPRNLPSFEPKFKNDIIVPDNAKKKGQSISTQSKDAPVISAEKQADIYSGKSKPPMMLGQISGGTSKNSNSRYPKTATEMANEERLAKDRELEEKVARAKQRANKILGNNQ